MALAAFPPPAADAPFLALCAQCGLTAPASPYINPDAQLAEMLVAGQKAAEAKIEELIHNMAKPVNGWQNSIHVFDYNLDYFELGTENEPEWQIADRKIAYYHARLGGAGGAVGQPWL